MLSQLSKGYGSWTAGYVDPYFGEKKHHVHEHDYTLPDIEHESHIHGVTVGSRSGRSTAMSWTTTRRSREPTMDGIPLPKTYTTRQGALQLYVGPDDLDDDDSDENEDKYMLKPKYVEIKRPHGQELIDLSLKLGTMERLAMSVLQFGDEEYDHEHTSITDAKNKAFLKFLHDVDKGVKPLDIDSSVQPGGDLNNYIRDLKSRASNRSSNMHISKSRESLELQAILRGLDNSNNWPMSYSQDGASSIGQFTRPVSRVSSRGASPGPPSTPRSTYQVLSAKKVCASIKSGSYLGRPSSKLSVYDDDTVEGEVIGPYPSASITRPIWSPKDSTDDYLSETRKRFEEEGDSDSGKRRGLKERSFLTNNSQLYKGRNARKGEGQRANEVKVTITGDWDSHSQGHGQNLTHIEEELGESLDPKKKDENLRRFHSADGLHEVQLENANEIKWVERVTKNNDDFISGTRSMSVEQDNEEEDSQTDSSGVIDVEIDERQKQVQSPQQNEFKTRSRPSTGDLKVRSRPDSSHKVKVNSRPNSAKSAASFTGSTSTHTPSIITLQSFNPDQKPSPKQDGYYALQKRRNTYAYDPNKGLIRTHILRRKSVDNINPKKHNSSSMVDFSFLKNSQVIQGANKYPVGEGHLYPSRSSSKNNFGWTADSDLHSDWPGNDYYEDATDAVGQHLLDDNQELLLGDIKSELVEKDVRNQPDHEIAVIDQEEYVLDNIAECNEEIKQIEAQADERMSDSDSDSSMDEELIKVILSGGHPNDIKGQGQIETTSKDGKDADSKMEGNDLERDIDNKEMEEKISISRSGSQLSGEGQLEVVGEGHIQNPTDDVVKTEQDVEVDEEHASEIGSTKSGRKARSKRSKSRVSTEDGDDSEYLLPTLESDRYLEEKDGSTVEDNQTVNDEQTGFSGSTDSYSDLLASGKNSRPQSGNQSIGHASTNQSRPVSANQSRPTSAAQSRRNSSENQSRPNSANASPAENAEQVSATHGDEKFEVTENTAKEVDSTTKLETNDDSGERKLENINNDSKNKLKDVATAVSEVNKSNIPEKPNAEGKAKSVQADIKQEAEKPADVGQKEAPKQEVPKPQPPKQAAVKTVDLKQTDVKVKDDGKKPVDTKTAPENKKLLVTPKAEKVVNEKKPAGHNVPPAKNVQSKPTKVAGHKPDTRSKGHEAGKKSSGPVLSRTVVEGEGLLEPVAGESKLSGSTGDGLVDKDAHSIVAELDALGLGPKSGKGLTYPLLPPGKRPKAPKEKAKIPDHIAEALSRHTDASRENLEQDLERRGFLKDGKVTAMVGESLSGPTLEAVGEGLTEEELELAKLILQQKLDEAKSKLEGKSPAPKPKGKKAPVGKGGAKKGGKKKKGQNVIEELSPEQEREAIRLKHEQEKKQREKEAEELQKRIAEKRRLMMEQEDMTSARSKELKEEMERLEREAEAIQRAEDEAREILADVRKKQREEREARRKADLERKKQDALERREKEKRELEEKRRKEMEMNEKIADAEMRRRIREEEERKIAEEERLAHERYEEEMREAQRLAEEEEERLKEMERQAEEEAMQRLIEEREAAERERRRLRDEEEALQDAERIKMMALEAEHRRLEEEKRKIQEAEMAKKEAERQRVLELRRLEEEARMKMQEEIEKRRNEAMARRDHNLENKQHIDKLKHNQGITRAWTFSYFVHWPRETYERPIGAPDPRKVVKINNPAPKKVVEPPPDSAAATAPAAS